jgi:conjugative transfer signal peptidase TraF
MTRLAFSALAVALIAGSAAQIACKPSPLLTWNVTASAPIGLYRRSTSPLERGSWVLLQLPPSVRSLAADRGYLPSQVPMVKRIAALQGDSVCRSGQAVTVNGTIRAIALARDSAGREMPVWAGCRVLQRDQVLVLTDPPSSFDGRYFGVLSRQNVIERIAPLWTF